MRIAWLGIGCISLALGALGAALPLLPSTPFVLLAAFCFARSSPAFHRRLLESPTFGKAIRDWQAHRAISGRAKAVSVTAMALSLGVSVILGIELLLVVVQALVLSGAAAFILTRRSAP